MTFPPVYDVSADTAAWAAAQAQSQDDENRRRQLAAGVPGAGSLVQLGQPPSGAGVGIADVDMPVAGLGYSTGPVTSSLQVASYVSAPDYAPGIVGGIGYAPGAVTDYAARSSSRIVTDGQTVWFGTDGPAGAADVISPAIEQPRRRRLLDLFRRRR